MKVSFGQLYPTTLGFERMFRDLESMLDGSFESSNEKFPPHNIIKLDEARYVVELAVAGFNQDEIDVTVNEGILEITGSKKDDDSEVNYLYKGIGTRSFTKMIRLVDTIEVKGAEYKDGILRIGLENIIPESQKPKKIEISSLHQFTQPKIEVKENEVKTA